MLDVGGSPQIEIDFTLATEPASGVAPCLANGYTSEIVRISERLSSRGYELIEHASLEELRGTLLVLRHNLSGATIVKILNDDSDKLFGIAVKTPPKDSTGIEHVTEHIVLDSSEQIPYPDVFGHVAHVTNHHSLNAQTEYDHTIYFAGSRTIAEHRQLQRYILSCVLQPKCSSEAFEREAHRVEPFPRKDALREGGIVDNEMKEYYSNLEHLHLRAALKHMFPNSHLEHDSAGDPIDLKRLRHEDVLNYVKERYVPSNALFYFYGDTDLFDDLDELEPFIASIPATPPSPPIAVETPIPISHPRTITEPYPVNRATAADGNSLVSVNWCLCERKTTDPETIMALRVLKTALVGLDSSPIPQALLDSGLGDCVDQVEGKSPLAHLLFSVGLGNTSPSKTQEIEELVLAALNKIVRTGFDTDLLSAALGLVEMRIKERWAETELGERSLMRSARAFTFDQKQVDVHACEEHLEKLRAKIGTGYFTDLLKNYIIRNGSRLTLVMVPDNDLHKEREAKLDRYLWEKEALLGPEDYRALREAERHRENAACAPTGELFRIFSPPSTDSLRSSYRPPPELHFHGDSQAISTITVPGNGLVYLDIWRNLKAVPDELLSLVPIYVRCVRQGGQAGDRSGRFLTSLQQSAPEINDEAVIAPSPSGDPGAYMLMRCTIHAPRLEDFKRDIWTAISNPNILDSRKVREFVCREIAATKGAIENEPIEFAMDRAAASIDPIFHIEDRLSGIEYIGYLKKLRQRIDQDWKNVQRDLELLHAIMLDRGSTHLHLSLAQDHQAAWVDLAHNIHHLIPEAPNPRQIWNLESNHLLQGFVIEATGNHIGHALDLHWGGFDLAALRVLASYCEGSDLWRQVRLSGGAYGEAAKLRASRSALIFGSSADPHFGSTIRKFRSVGERLEKLTISEDELQAAITSAVRQFDFPTTFQEQGLEVLRDYRSNINPGQEREALLEVDVDSFRRASRMMGLLSDQSFLGHRPIAVLSNRRRLEGIQIRNPELEMLIQEV